MRYFVVLLFSFALFVGIVRGQSENDILKGTNSIVTNDDITPCPSGCQCHVDNERRILGQVICNSFLEAIPFALADTIENAKGPADIGDEFRGIRHIEMSDNDFSTLMDRQLEFCGFPLTNDVRMLTMMNDKITELPQSCFRNLGSLRQLDIAYNEIRRIKADQFSKNGELRKLYMEGNQLKRLKRPMFKGLKSLVFLDLSYNHINDIEAAAFKELPNLENLKLEDNQIGSIRREWTRHLTKLQRLDLTNNQIKKLRPSPLNYMKSLEILKLRGNKIGSLYAEGKNCEGFKSFQTEDDDLDEDFCFSLQTQGKLQQLNLECNRIHLIYWSDVNALAQLKRIKMGGNKGLIEVGDNEGSYSVKTNLAADEACE